MEIILKQDVEKLGEKNDLVKVRDGYAINFLLPRGLAVVATTGAKKELAENMKQAAHKLAKIKEEAQKQAEKLGAIKLRIETLAGKGGKLYGAITPLQIANHLKDQGIDLDRKRISIKEDITEVGTFTAHINLHKEVKVDLKFEVVEKAAE
jgi:large subunit ribosomal protein L9